MIKYTVILALFFISCSSPAHNNASSITTRTAVNGAVTDSRDYKKSVTTDIIAAAEKGDRNAQFELARRYANGTGIMKNYREAIYWLKKSAEQGHTEAQFYLGWIYLHGKGVADNKHEALYWLEMAAQQNDAYSQYLSGRIYEDGFYHQFQVDTEKAEYWYHRACKNFIILACEGQKRLRIINEQKAE
jgi:TPR repeat protein